MSIPYRQMSDCCSHSRFEEDTYLWKPSAQADRAALRELLRTRPDLSLKDIAHRLHRSYTWAKDWAKRLASAPPDDLDVLHSRSRARSTPQPEWDALVLRRLEQMRLFPPEGLQRTPAQWFRYHRIYLAHVRFRSIATRPNSADFSL